MPRGRNATDLLIPHKEPQCHGPFYITCGYRSTCKVMECQIIPGDRGGKVLLVDGYKYHKQVTRNQTIPWQCARRRICQVRIKTNTFDLQAADPDIRLQHHRIPQHDHGPDDDAVRRSEIRRRLADAAKEDPTRPLKRVFDDEMRVGGQGGGGREGTTFDSVRSTM